MGCCWNKEAKSKDPKGGKRKQSKPVSKDTPTDEDFAPPNSSSRGPLRPASKDVKFEFGKEGSKASRYLEDDREPGARPDVLEHQQQQLLLRDSNHLDKQQKHRKVQRLAADTYCRLLAQIEALFKKLNVPVEARFARFDQNPDTSDVQDLLVGAEALLNSLRVYNNSVLKQQLQPLRYPAAQDSIAEFKKAFGQIQDEPENETVKLLVYWVITCLENNSFGSKLPKELSEAIMSEAEMTQLLDVETPGGITKMLVVNSNVQQLTSIAEAKLQQGVDEPYDPNQPQVPLITSEDLRKVRAKPEVPVESERPENQFL